MKWKIGSIFVLLISILAAIYKFQPLGLNLNDLLQKISIFRNKCEQNKIIIWTAATVKSYDESIYYVIRNVSHELNHTVIKESNENGTWDILWSYEYIFDRFTNNIRFMKLKPHQLINHFPGLTFITNKLHLAVSTTQRFIPSAFNFPNLKNEFLYYAKISPHQQFVVKSMDKGGIQITPFEKINFAMGSWSYLQVYIESLLIENHAFDIGIYILITSIDPIKIYKWDQDVLIRFCPEPYHPFDLNVKEKYVCSLKHKNIWELDEFKSHSKHKFTGKDALSNYLLSKGLNASKMWSDMDMAINTILAEKMKVGLRFTKVYTDKSGNKLNQMFELIRADFVVDEELNVYLLEANMSPELYDVNEVEKTMSMQIVRDVLRIMGAESYQELKVNSTFNVNPHHIATNIDECAKCDNDCTSPSCDLCLPCLTEEFKELLYKSYKEHQRRGAFRRIFPNKDNIEEEVWSQMGENVTKLAKWYEKKCEWDPDWC